MILVPRFLWMIGCLIMLASCASIPLTGQLILVTITEPTPIPTFQHGYPPSSYGQISAPTDATLTQLERRYQIERIEGWPIRSLGVYCSVMALRQGADLNNTLTQLKAEKNVQLAQIMNNFEVQSATEKESYFEIQYGKYAAQIRQLHQQSTGEGVKVAVIDTGVDRKHPNLKSRINFSANFVGDNEFDNDIHGTAVAGIIAAEKNNYGAEGMAPGVNLLALKACWQIEQNTIAARCNTFTLAKAISAAIEKQSDIINLSLAGPADPLLSQLLNFALKNNIIVIAAQQHPDDFPAILPGVIAASSNPTNTGIVHIASINPAKIEAAATELLSTSPGGHYDFFSGSSMAAARISGLTALIKQNQPKLSTTEAVNELNRLVDAIHLATLACCG